MWLTAGTLAQEPDSTPGVLKAHSAPKHAWNHEVMGSKHAWTHEAPSSLNNENIALRIRPPSAVGYQPFLLSYPINPCYRGLRCNPVGVTIQSSTFKAYEPLNMTSPTSLVNGAIQLIHVRDEFGILGQKLPGVNYIAGNVWVGGLWVSTLWLKCKMVLISWCKHVWWQEEVLNQPFCGVIVVNLLITENYLVRIWHSDGYVVYLQRRLNQLT